MSTKHKVLLVNTPFTLGHKQKFSTPPLGLLYIATFLQKNGIEAQLLDTNIKSFDIDDISRFVLNSSPDLVGISSMTSQISYALKIAKEVKKEDKNIKICLGGSHVNSVKEEVFSFSSDIDFLAYGEGEYTLLDLINNINKPNQVDGLIYKDNGKIRINKPREFIENLDVLPFPDLSLIEINEYAVPYAPRYPIATMMCSRGCPFTCTFCDAYKTMGRKARLRSPKNIVDEMEYLEDWGVKHVIIKDSTFTLNAPWVLEICREIMERNLDLTWNCNSRVNTISHEILSTMKRAGCTQIGFGVESGSEDVLQNVRKNITIEQIKKAFKMTADADIETYGFFMIGNPGDNPTNVRKTIELAKEIDPDLVAFAIATPYPGTDLYDWALSSSALEEYWYMNNIDDYVGVVLSRGIMDLPGLSKEEAGEFLRIAYREFFFRPAYILRNLRKLSNPARAKTMIKAFFELLFHTILMGNCEECEKK